MFRIDNFIVGIASRRAVGSTSCLPAIPSVGIGSNATDGWSFLIPYVLVGLRHRNKFTFDVYNGS
jgi:hypothetical protein